MEHRDDLSLTRANPRRPTRGPATAGRLAAMLASAALLAAWAGACTGPGDAARRGILRFETAGEAPAAVRRHTSPPREGPSGSTDGRIEAPEEVVAGETFTATISTVGMNGCWDAVDERVRVEGGVAVVVPFDTPDREEGVACTTALEFLEHPVHLSFDQPGDAVIRVEGRRVVGRDVRESEPLTLADTVRVVR